MICGAGPGGMDEKEAWTHAERHCTSANSVECTINIDQSTPALNQLNAFSAYQIPADLSHPLHTFPSKDQLLIFH